MQNWLRKASLFFWSLKENAKCCIRKFLKSQVQHYNRFGCRDKTLAVQYSTF